MPPARPKRKGKAAAKPQPKKAKAKPIRKAPRRSQRTRASRGKKLPVASRVDFRPAAKVVIPVTHVKWLDLPGEGRRRYFLSEYTRVRNRRTYLLEEVAGRIVEVTDAFWKAQRRLVRTAKAATLRLVRKDDAA